jgi:hypothetical protein
MAKLSSAPSASASRFALSSPRSLPATSVNRGAAVGDAGASSPHPRRSSLRKRLRQRAPRRRLNLQPPRRSRWLRRRSHRRIPPPAPRRSPPPRKGQPLLPQSLRLRQSGGNVPSPRPTICVRG